MISPELHAQIRRLFYAEHWRLNTIAEMLDGNDYSIPHTLVRRPLTLVAAEHQVRLLDGSTEVARHARTYDRGQRVEDGCWCGR